MKDLKHFRHQISMNVRFMDLDALHHVNNARYLNFLEEARIAYSQDILGLFRDLKQLNVLVARIEIDYLKPIHLGKENIAAKALQTLVTFDVKQQRTIDIPEEIREKVEAYEPAL